MKRRYRGLTLVELMVTLAVAITLLAVGIPAFQGMESNSRAASLANGISTAFSLARTEALSSGIPVAVCPKSAIGATSTCGGATSWANGWLVFRDPAVGGTVGQPESAADVVRGFDPPRGQPPTVGTGGATFVRFGTDGVQNNGLAIAVNQVVMTLDQPGDSANRYRRCLIVNHVGSIRVERQTTCP